MVRKKEAQSKQPKMRAADLKRFRRLLLAYREKLASSMDSMEDEALNKNRQEASGDLAVLPEMVDIASDNYNQEFTIGLIQNQNQVLRMIDDALAKIEQGQYGVCESCNQSIKKARLSALPYARLCIECQSKEELAV